MSGWLWGYNSKCDGDFCPYNCDKCWKSDYVDMDEEGEEGKDDDTGN